MGYHSDVGLVLNREAAVFVEAAAKENAELSHLLQEETDEKRCDEETGARLFYWESTKWYESGEDASVAALIALLDVLDDDALPEYPEGAKYRFIRIGEEATDVHERGDFTDNPFDFGWSRKIEFTGSQCKGKP